MLLVGERGVGWLVGKVRVVGVLGSCDYVGGVGWCGGLRFGMVKGCLGCFRICFWFRVL